MRNPILLLFICLLAAGCGKDKYTTAPQITYKSVKPDRVGSNVIIGSDAVPIITINVTDAEGDLGFKNGKDTSYIFIRNLLINRVDSFYLPDIQSVATKNFQGDIIINSFDVLRGSNRPRPKVDTLFFEIYIVDFAKNKSNVITTADPIYYVSP